MEKSACAMCSHMRVLNKEGLCRTCAKEMREAITMVAMAIVVDRIFSFIELSMKLKQEREKKDD